MSNSLEKDFVQSFLGFLHSQIRDGKFTDDSLESAEVAIQCLEQCFSLPPSTGGSNDQPSIDLFELYCSSQVVSPERKEEAEKLKNEGNRLMKEEKYQEALTAYNQAINIDATNSVFYCNRAAAHSRLGDYTRAADDCKMSLKYDPTYSKAFGRLGLAYSKMGRYEQAVDAYKKALEIEPNNEDYKNNMGVAQERLASLSAAPGAEAGGLPGFGGLDFAAALNNPALVNMASRMMTDPNIQQMFTQLSGMNDVNALVETGRQLAQQISSQNPELIESIRRQMQGGPGGPTEDGQNPPPGTT